MPKYRILVASYTPNITTLEFDSSKKTLKDIAQSPAGTNPSWIAAHPSDKTLILATNEVTDGKVHLFKLKEDGGLKLLESMGSAGEDPAHLAVLEDEVVVGNYSSGTVLAISFSKSAPHFLSSKTPIQFSGSGPNSARQSSSHPHQIFPISATEILIPDLGADRVVRLTKGKDGEWAETGDLKAGAGEGPRHVQLHDGVLYIVDELTNKIAAHKFPPTASSSLIASLSTLPEPVTPPPPTDRSGSAPTNGSSEPLPLLAAELLLTKTPTPLLFVTNRNEPHPDGDSIAIFSPLKTSSGPDGFELIASTRTGLRHVRGAAFGVPDDKYLIVGGADKGGVKVYERSGPRGEKLTEVASMHGVVAPTGFLWLSQLSLIKNSYGLTEELDLGERQTNIASGKHYGGYLDLVFVAPERSRWIQEPLIPKVARFISKKIGVNKSVVQESLRGHEFTAWGKMQWIVQSDHGDLTGGNTIRGDHIVSDNRETRDATHVKYWSKKSHCRWDRGPAINVDEEIVSYGRAEQFIVIGADFLRDLTDKVDAYYPHLDPLILAVVSPISYLQYISESEIVQYRLRAVGRVITPLKASYIVEQDSVVAQLDMLDVVVNPD
ncbi:hypothetical protein FRC07_006740 [Ceratobasidium sp. 392]|nr:hypothetical protein FRC07_006740 [Ceratobasidium sp. 392]